MAAIDVLVAMIKKGIPLTRSKDEKDKLINLLIESWDNDLLFENICFIFSPRKMTIKTLANQEKESPCESFDANNLTRYLEIFQNLLTANETDKLLFITYLLRISCKLLDEDYYGFKILTSNSKLQHPESNGALSSYLLGRHNKRERALVESMIKKNSQRLFEVGNKFFRKYLIDAANNNDFIDQLPIVTLIELFLGATKDEYNEEKVISVLNEYLETELSPENYNYIINRLQIIAEVTKAREQQRMYIDDILTTTPPLTTDTLRKIIHYCTCDPNIGITRFFSEAELVAIFGETPNEIEYEYFFPLKNKEETYLLPVAIVELEYGELIARVTDEDIIKACLTYNGHETPPSDTTRVSIFMGVRHSQKRVTTAGRKSRILNIMTGNN